MIYANYDYYANEYFGKGVQEEDFRRLALRASQYIDYITQGRAEARSELEAVKMCCCALAEQYQTIETAQALARSSLSAGMNGTSGELQSQTVGGWSKSYRSGGDSAQAASQAAESGQSSLLATARHYLANTGLLYRGMRCCL